MLCVSKASFRSYFWKKGKEFPRWDVVQASLYSCVFFLFCFLSDKLECDVQYTFFKTIVVREIKYLMHRDQ